jgi:type I restriction-modification system DNA methylase subunit
MLKSYLERIFEVTKRGDATESSYYSSLEKLLKDCSKSVGKKNIHVTSLPKKTEAGNPDFRVWDGKQKIVGYIEAKAPTTKYLDQVEDTEQLKRYLHTFPNLLLTNFFEFRLYRSGQLSGSVQIGRPFMIYKLDRVPSVENKEKFIELLDKYFSFSLPKIHTAKSLAVELAKRTRFLKEEVVAEELKEEAEKKKGNILGFYEAFREYLISGLSREDFADLYSQTITYGLFAARTRSKNGFNRKLAYDNIPPTVGILRDVFEFISLGKLPQPMEWIIDDIAEVLAVTDVNKILHKYFHEGKGKDPIIHFYETFLAEYDPKMREKRGVYYTPEPVVSYIVRSLHHILKEHFDKPLGFASDSVTVLDPAAGTLTFLAEAAKLAVDSSVSEYGDGIRESYIREKILNNFYAFELMMAPYAIGHLKMSFLLEELGYRLKEDDRFKLYITNTLEMEELAQTDLPGMASLSEESHLAGKVKKEQPILVILGNPPYSKASANKSAFIDKEMGVYKEDVRSEKNIQPLSDDYIKFIRFAHWKIEKDGKGLIGMITNNSYLSGLIHRGMRKKLLESFNEIYVLNLHGNSRIGETCPDGSKDENVFDIQQGVSIILLLKDKKQKGLGKVYYEDIYGLRESKYKVLDKNDIKSIRWIELQISEPHYFFVKKDFSLQTKYDKFISIPKIFIKNSSGVKTHRDHFVIGFSKEEIKQRMRTFTSNLPDDIVKEGLKLKDTKDFKVTETREKIRQLDWKKSIVPYAYRPFDIRNICYRTELIDRDRADIMKHFIKDNIGIIVDRTTSNNIPFNHVFISDTLIDVRVLPDYGGAPFLMPLYLYPAKEKKNLFDFNDSGEYQPNINPEIFKVLKESYKKKPTPERIFYCIYAVLYSNTYRTKYAEFLKIDFPRVPFTSDYKLLNQRI